MRTHTEIIADAGGWKAVRDALGFNTDDAKAKFWSYRSSIPCEYWKALVDLGYTTADELTLASHRRRYLKEKAKL